MRDPVGSGLWVRGVSPDAPRPPNPEPGTTRAPREPRACPWGNGSGCGVPPHARAWKEPRGGSVVPRACAWGSTGGFETGSKQGKRGFTLLEVLLAIVLSLGAFWCLDAFARGMLAVSESEGLFTAMNLAQERVEAIRALPYASIVNVVENPVPGFPNYQRSVTVTTNPSNTVPPRLSTYKTVNVVVTWQLPKAGAQSVTITTYAADY